MLPQQESLQNNAANSNNYQKPKGNNILKLWLFVMAYYTGLWKILSLVNLWNENKIHLARKPVCIFSLKNEVGDTSVHQDRKISL